MKSPGYVLGIDTSNYTTSIAAAGADGSVLLDMRRLLEVKQGERGLRQSDALFQHIKNIPEMLAEADVLSETKLRAVSVSVRPRPRDDSYMPVFLAGKSIAESVAKVTGVPCFSFSHQEGHIEAVRRFAMPGDIESFISCHFSGGTCEILRTETVKDGAGYDVVPEGGSLDISFGQVIDRCGVMMGLSFPCGAEMDRMAVASAGPSDVLTEIKCADGKVNLSGTDTQIRRLIEKTGGDSALVKELFEKLASAMYRMILQVCEKTGIAAVLMAGGVSSSVFIKEILKNDLEKRGIDIYFDEKGLSQDNAVGTALLGSRCIWG